MFGSSFFRRNVLGVIGVYLRFEETSLMNCLRWKITFLSTSYGCRKLSEIGLGWLSNNVVSLSGHANFGVTELRLLFLVLKISDVTRGGNVFSII